MMMEKYKRTLQRRILLMALTMIAAAVILSLQVFGFFGAELESDFSNGVVSGLQSGLLTGLILVFTFFIIRYQRATQDIVKLKLLQNKENDERTKAIKQKSGGNIVIFYSVVFILAGIIAGYYNTTVFYTLIVCAVFQLNVSAFLKIYFLKRY
jgi:hypothetical protein